MKVHHIGYLVKNIEKSADAFRALGFEDTSFSDEFMTNDTIRGCVICFLKNENTVVELVSPNTEDSPIRGLMKTYKNTPYHLCYESDDIEKDMAELKKKGFMVFLKPEEAPAIAGCRVVFLTNPRIGIVEIAYRENSLEKS